MLIPRTNASLVRLEEHVPKKTKLELQIFRAAVGAGLHRLRRSGCGFDDGAARESRRGARSEERLGRRVEKATLDSCSQDGVVAPGPRAGGVASRSTRRRRRLRTREMGSEICDSYMGLTERYTMFQRKNTDHNTLLD